MTITSVPIRSRVPLGHVAYRSLFSPFSNKPWFLRVCSTTRLKTLREKKKLLVTSNLFFSHSVFYPLGKLLPFSTNLKLSSAKSFRKSLKFVVWEGFKPNDRVQRRDHGFTMATSLPLFHSSSILLLSILSIFNLLFGVSVNINHLPNNSLVLMVLMRKHV